MHNYIKRNTISTALSACGGGIGAGPPGSSAFVVIKINKIRNNTAIGDVFPMGGGLDIRCNGIIINNEIKNNLCQTNTNMCGGGGLLSFSWGGYIHVEGNVISHNKALSYSDALESGIGGGLAVVGNTGTVCNNIIEHNEVSALNSCFGPGAFFEYTDTTLVFTNNTIANNSFRDGYCNGGAVCVWLGDLKILNNIMYDNSATVGGGICAYSGSNSQIINNTITENTATQFGGGLYALYSTLGVMNTIFWNNLADSTGDEAYLDNSSPISIVHSNLDSSKVIGLWNSTNNISSDPLFSDSLFRVSDYSLCIGSGTITHDLNGILCYSTGTDIYGNPRPNPEGSNPDIGAYESELGEPEPDGIDDKSRLYPDEFCLFQNYPNPFNPTTAISYQLSGVSHVELNIFNILGQKVVTLVSGKQPAGNHKVEWDASGFASGVYLYRLETDQGFVQTRKLILLK